MSWVNHFDMASQNAHTSSHAISTGMPSISEDEAVAEADEPANRKSTQYDFTKTAPPKPLRRESLLTIGLHTDSESHDEGATSSHQRPSTRLPSRSSTCSTYSVRSDMTSEDGQTSPITQPSLPNSPNKFLTFLKKPTLGSLFKPEKKEEQPARPSVDSAKSPSDAGSEPSVEATLGRKRCISFACGKKAEAPAEKKAPSRPKSSVDETAHEETDKPKPVQRLCSLRFDCPTRESAKTLDENARPQRAPRKASPAPPKPRSDASPLSPKSSSPDLRRKHRGSDSTIRLDSPKSVRKSTPPPPPPPLRNKKGKEAAPTKSEGTTFHEFAGSDEETEDWVQEVTVHKSRLTVDDTLKKETDIRHLTEEAVAEEAQDEEDQDALVYGQDGDDDDEEDDDFDEDHDNDDEDDEDVSDSDDVSDGGFQTDDEEGFAESDDESDDGSDYEWWAPRRKGSPELGTMLPVEVQRPDVHRSSSHVSLDAASDSSAASPSGPAAANRRKLSKAISIPMPELPDSTDFVCGTIDEDRPLEEAYMSCMEQRKAAKHRIVPQDIDPTFPQDDPDIADSDNDNDADAAAMEAKDASDTLETTVFPGQLEHLDGEEARGRRKVSPRHSPKRHKSPAPPKRTLHNRSPAPAPLHRTTSHKSPAPAAPKRTMSHKSPAPVNRRKATPSPRRRSPMPKRGRSPAMRKGAPAPLALFGSSPHRANSVHANRTGSPPPSDANSSSPGPRTLTLGNAFLGHRPSLTHTSSLPRSPAPFKRKGSGYFDQMHAEADDDDEDTAREDRPYSRGAIDIVQGLERKRLRRRQKFHEKYLKKEERKMQRGERAKRPMPGKGAQRMRQIGIETAIYRGKRVLSV